jgi:hypothetical protein
MTTGRRADGHPTVLVKGDFLHRLHYRFVRRGWLPMWVVYRPVTREYPGKWVARMHVTIPEAKPTRFVMTHDTLYELRNILPPGLAMVARSEHDVPEIQETWL